METYQLLQVTYFYGPHPSALIEESCSLLHVGHEGGRGRTQHLTDVADLIVLAGPGKERPSQVELSKHTAK